MDLRSTTIAIMLMTALFFMPQSNGSEISHSSLTQPADCVVQDDFTDYMTALQDKLQKNWQPPDFMEEGHVKVYFKLNRHGQLMAASVIESSGNDIYDESALEALKDCAPFGEFPADSTKESISIKYSFDTILIEEERMHGYYELAKVNLKKNPRMALEYINMALNKVGGDEASYFLYKKRAEIKEALGDYDGATKDYESYNKFVKRMNIKRVHLLEHIAETKQSAYLYHYLAYAYEQVNDYPNAITAIDKAIELTYENWNLKRYRNQLVQKQQAS